MKDLIFTTAIGERFVRQAELLKTSLDEFSGLADWDFEVVQDAEFPASPKHSGWMGRIMRGLKGFPGYRQVLYLDSDVVCVGDLQVFLCMTGVRAFIEHRTFDTPYKWAVPGGTIGEWGWNSGIIMASAEQWPLLARTWYDEIIRLRAWEQYCFDQNPFNTLIWEKRLDIRPLYQSWCFFPLYGHWRDAGPETKLVHFIGGGEERIKGMTECLEFYRAEKRKWQNKA